MRKVDLLGLVAAVLMLSSCAEDPIPKPRGYFRIELPEKEYVPYTSDCGFTFEIPTYGRVVKYRGAQDQPCSFNLVFPTLKATLYLTHLKINDGLEPLLEDAYAMTHKHDAKANSLKRLQLTDPALRKFGTSYLLGGDVATPFQFFMHDSTDNFLRGSLYFRTLPNADSLAPVVAYIQKDLDHFLDTFKWAENE